MKLKMLRDDSDVVILQQKATEMAKLIGLVFIADQMLIAFLVIAYGISWQLAIAHLTLTAAGLVAILYSWYYERQYVFERVARQLLIVQKTLFGTSSEEFAFDDVLSVRVRKEASDGRPVFHVDMRLADERTIDVTPAGGLLEAVADRQSSCKEVATLFNGIFGLQNLEIDDRTSKAAPEDEYLSRLMLRVQGKSTVTEEPNTKSDCLAEDDEAAFAQTACGSR